MHTLALTMIVLNEARSIQQTIRSCKGVVDCVVLLDTGSTDDTIDLAIDTCARLNIPIYVRQEPFVDFSTTRNSALELAQKHAKFSLQLSGDEYLRGPAASQLNKFLSRTELDILHVDVHVNSIHFSSTRIVRNGSPWRWTGVVHEYMRHPHDVQAPPFAIDGLWIDHEESDPERKLKRFERDAELLRNELIKNPSDPRSIFYLAQTLEGLGRIEEAHDLNVQRANIEVFTEERYEAAFRAARLSQKMKMAWEHSFALYLKAHLLDPRCAEPLVAIAEHYVETNEYTLALIFAQRAFAMPMPKSRLLNIIHEVYEWRAADVLSVAAMGCGELDIAKVAFAKAIANAPDAHQERIRKNAAVIRFVP